MATVAGLQRCDGFLVEGPDGVMGRVEETWFDGPDHPGALAIRRPDGRRVLLRLGDVAAVDADAQEVLARGDAKLLDLDAPSAGKPDGMPVWKVVLFGLAALAILISVEIGTMFVAAYVASGHPPY